MSYYDLLKTLKKNPQRSRAIAQIMCWLNKHEDRRTDPRNLHKESGAYNPRTQHSETEDFWDNPATQISLNWQALGSGKDPASINYRAIEEETRP